MRLQMTGLLPIVRDVTAIHRSWSLSIDQHARSFVDNIDDQHL